MSRLTLRCANPSRAATNRARKIRKSGDVIAASVFDHPGVLLLIVFVALVRWLTSKAKADTQKPQTPATQSPSPPPPSRPIPRGGETQTEEERIRKFLEALGQPAGTTPPVVQRRRQIRPDVFSPLPPLKTKPPPLPVAPTTPFKPPPLPAEDRSGIARTAAQPAFEVREMARQTSSEPAPETPRGAPRRLEPRINLRTPADLRTAIVMREIFGPPRSLQEFDLTNSY